MFDGNRCQTMVIRSKGEPMSDEDFQRFHHNTLDELRTQIDKEQVDIKLSDDVSALAHPVRVGSRVAANSLAILPMEGV